VVVLWPVYRALSRPPEGSLAPRARSLTARSIRPVVIEVTQKAEHRVPQAYEHEPGRNREGDVREEHWISKEMSQLPPLAPLKGLWILECDPPFRKTLIAR